MDSLKVMQIIKEELSEAELRIIKRLNDDQAQQPDNLNKITIKLLPDNENYAKALSLYQNGGTHSGTAKALGVSMAQIKKYYNWLVINGYLPMESAELSDVEKLVVDCIYNKKMSLRETANDLGCSISNVTYRRDSALRKGYVPKEKE